jgi:hypothetical protein
MTRTQIQLPDELYRQAKAMAAAREISLAELVRRGLEYMLAVSAQVCPAEKDAWQLPEPAHLGKTDPFADPEWRVKLYMREGAVAETPAAYGRARRPPRRTCR